jgi:hypothetical protein
VVTVTRSTESGQAFGGPGGGLDVVVVVAEGVPDGVADGPGDALADAS